MIYRLRCSKEKQPGMCLLIGWGSTYGAIKTAVHHQQKKGHKVSFLHLRYIHPFPKNLSGIFPNFRKILVPEINLGQLVMVLRAEFLIPAVGLNKVQGLPFRAEEIEMKIEELLKEVRSA